eukprot:275685-Pyramimonas_sp.AAC.1
MVDPLEIPVCCGSAHRFRASLLEVCWGVGSGVWGARPRHVAVGTYAWGTIGFGWVGTCGVVMTGRLRDAATVQRERSREEVVEREHLRLDGVQPDELAEGPAAGGEQRGWDVAGDSLHILRRGHIASAGRAETLRSSVRQGAGEFPRRMADRRTHDLRIRMSANARVYTNMRHDWTLGFISSCRSSLIYNKGAIARGIHQEQDGIRQ